MSSENCKYHLRGHCRSKSFCLSNHNIQNCPHGKLCNHQDLCQFRHVKICPLFPNCGYMKGKAFIYFTKCSYSHTPPIVHPPYHSLVPRLQYPLPPAPLLPGEFRNLPGIYQRNTVMPATQNNTESAPAASIVKNCEVESLKINAARK